MGFNVVKGWPIGEALEDSSIPFPGVTIESGMFLKKVPHPTVSGQSAVRPVDIAGGDDNTNTNLVMFSVDRSAAFDVIDANRIPYIVGNAIVETDQLEAGATFTAADVGDPVYVSDAEPGKLTNTDPGGADTIIVGYFDGLTTLEDINGDQVDAIRIALVAVRN